MYQEMDKWVVWAALVCMLVFFILIIVILKRYRKVGPNEALIISGAYTFGKPKVVIGEGAFVWPMINRADVLSLEIVAVDVEIPKAITQDGKSVAVRAKAQVKIRNAKESVLAAAERFLGRGKDGIAEASREVLESHLRDAVQSSSSEEARAYPKPLTSKVEENAVMDLAGMGLEIVSFSVKEIAAA